MDRTKICNVCGREFIKKASESQKYWATKKFCSWKCGGIGQGHPLNKGQFQDGKMPWNKNLKGIHLSPKTEFKKGKLVGEEHPNWKGNNVTKGQFRRRARKVWKENNKEFRCRDCGTMAHVEIHHQDRNWTNNNVDNLQPLCESCHAKTHYIEDNKVEKFRRMN